MGPVVVLIFIFKRLYFSINSMQDFEIHGRAMQLGWGQENREEKMSNAEDFRVTIADQEQHSEKVSKS